MELPSEWPEYLEPLRPDEMTRHRIQKRVMASAEALRDRRMRTWFDVTAGWSVILAPIAAGLLVVFGTLAYRTSAPTNNEYLALDPAPESVELLPSLAPDAERLPTLLIDAVEPSRDAVLAAALIAP